ncbi:DNA repair protein RecN [Pseudoclavibacter triregionum]|nr:DNA repair protein RecN [Pseudoclavibacter triregionum]
MILDIDIDGLGVIDRASLPLGPGFTALTGETGAGKTMVVSALGLLLGGRAASGIVRAGRDRAVVEGRWEVPAEGPIADRVAALGGELEVGAADDSAELLVVRQVTAEGRSKAWLGGRSAPASALQASAEELVAIHGQSDQLRLRSEAAQRAALDAFGGEPVAAARAAVEAAWTDRSEAVAERDRIRGAEAERAREAERLREAVDAIEPIDPQPGEDDAVMAKIERLSNRESIRRDVAAANAVLRGDEADPAAPSVLELMQQAVAMLDRARQADPSLDGLADSLSEARYLIDDLVLRCSGYLDGLDQDGVGELPALDERMAQLADLKRRFGPGLDDVIGLYADAGQRLLELEGDTERLAELDRAAAEAEERLEAAAAELTALRRDAAERLAARVSDELAALAMPDALLRIDLAEAEEIRSHGRDRIAFLLRPHPGADPAPIGTAASGGELSRIMLALEVALADANPVPTFVFDEVDSGVGGAAAIEIGRRLRALSEHAQVIVVTHLAQVAAFATNHLRIEKASDGEVTSSSIRRLEGAERTAEIARLLSGLSSSESGHAHAEELLALAAGAGDPASGQAPQAHEPATEPDVEPDTARAPRKRTREG